LKATLIILLLPVNLFGQVVLSEVLYNEPGQRTLLEWVEIYNSAAVPADLHDYIFIANSDTNYFPNGSTIPPRTYAILARNLTSQDSSDSFENYWGNASGYWGDSDRELFPAFDIRLNLGNTSGYISIVEMATDREDSYSWASTTVDAYSMERNSVDPSSSTWHQSTDTNGSTPGRINSISFSDDAFDMVEISPRIISHNEGQSIEIIYHSSIFDRLTIEVFDDSGHRQRTLAPSGYTYQVRILWNGTDDQGQKLPPGIYLILVSAKTFQKTIPVVIAP
jgi:hypothetical protein